MSHLQLSSIEDAHHLTVGQAGCSPWDRLLALLGCGAIAHPLGAPPDTGPHSYIGV